MHPFIFSECIADVWYSVDVQNDVETSWKVREDKELASSDEELLNWIQKKISRAMKL